MSNKVLNILAWVVFVISIIAYIVDDGLSNEPLYFALASIFLVMAPRTIKN